MIIFFFVGIEQLFHSETQYSYFIPYKKEGSKISPNRGKLYDKYCNIKKEIHKITPVIKRKNVEDHVVGLNNDEGIFNYYFYILSI